MVHLIYRSERGVSSTDVTLSDFQSFIIVPALVALVDGSLEVYGAINEMLGGAEKPLAHVSNPTAPSSIVQGRQLSSITASLINASLVLVKDPGSSSSPGVFAETSLLFNYSIETDEHSVGKVNTRLSVQSVECYVIDDVSTSLSLLPV